MYLQTSLKFLLEPTSERANNLSDFLFEYKQTHIAYSIQCNYLKETGSLITCISFTFLHVYYTAVKIFMVSQKMGREGMLDWCTVAEKGELDTNQYSATPTLLTKSVKM